MYMRDGFTEKNLIVTEFRKLIHDFSENLKPQIIFPNDGWTNRFEPETAFHLFQYNKVSTSSLQNNDNY